MKVLSCVGKQSQDGRTFYNTAVEKDGQQIEATAFEQLQVGETIDDTRLARNKNDTGWYIKSVSKKGNYQRNDELIIAQVAFKGAVDLLIGNKLNVADLTSETCTKFAQIIKRTAANLSAPAPAPATPAGHPPTVSAPDPGKVPPPPQGYTEPIKSMGELRTRLKKTYSTLQTVAAQDAILGDSKLITDYDAAFQKVVDYMERDL